METRTVDRIRYHYEVERDLAARLKAASKSERMRLYGEVYNELYSRVPDIPHLAAQADHGYRTAYIAPLVEFLQPFLQATRTFMEIGPGDFKLSIAMARQVPHVYAVDVTDEVVKGVDLPPNVEFRRSDGCSIPVPAGSVDLAFSDQVMEHLHPDDAVEQLENIYGSLTPGGRYICITPNRLYGPHDVSKYFDDTASGLHLREYAVHDVAALFERAGFDRVEAYTNAGSIRRLRVPVPVIATVEKALDRLPPRTRKGLACSWGCRWLMRARVVGVKG